MKELKQFNIPFIGLKEGKHTFEYQIDKTFFKAFEFDEFEDAQIKATVNFVKKSTLMELDFFANGTVTVPCDTTNELFDLEFEGHLPLIIKFGPEYNDDNDDILVLPNGEYEINVAQFIYELIVLNIPNKRVHPGIADGSLESETLKKLEELKIKENKAVEEDATDPRWDKLKDLLTGKT